MTWSRRFDDPIRPPKGKPLVTLKDAAEGRNFIMHARIGMMRALNYGKQKPATLPRHKLAKTYGIVQ